MGGLIWRPEDLLILYKGSQLASFVLFGIYEDNRMLPKTNRSDVVVVPDR